MAPYNYGLSFLPILVHKPHPKGIIGIREIFRLNGHVSLVNAPGPSEKAGDYDQLGALLVGGYTDPCSKELGPPDDQRPGKPKKLSPSLGTL